jgi:hypothetical protein
MKSLITASDHILITVLTASGICIIILAFFCEPVPLQVAMVVAGLCFISLGLTGLKRIQDRNRQEENNERLMAKLDEIQQELCKEEGKSNSGIAIADVISSGLKYYAEHMNKKDSDE